MSMISEQVNDLKEYAKCEAFPQTTRKIFAEAADTIEFLSAKLQAANTERTTVHYNGGWIPCEYGFPVWENMKVIVTAIWDGFEYTTESYFYHGKFYNRPYYQIPVGQAQEFRTGDKVLAWCKLPEPYKPR